MRPFIHYGAPQARVSPTDRRIAVPEIAGNFDDLTRTADWLPFGEPSAESDRTVIGDELPPGELGWLVTRAVSLHAF